MGTSKSGVARFITGMGGVVMIVSLFLPWASVEEVDATGWELWTLADLLFLLAGIFAIGAAITGGRFGLFRPDLSLNGATDLLGVLSTLLLAWLVVFDFPEEASREVGVFLALGGAMAVAGGVGDYSVLRPGAPAFPRTTGTDRA
jgi:hypothetical protein